MPSNSNGGTGERTPLISRETPGRHSGNVAVRGLAYTWHVTKVTLLSSTSITC